MAWHRNTFSWPFTITRAYGMHRITLLVATCRRFGWHPKNDQLYWAIMILGNSISIREPLWEMSEEIFVIMWYCDRAVMSFFWIFSSERAQNYPWLSGMEFHGLRWPRIASITKLHVANLTCQQRGVINHWSVASHRIWNLAPTIVTQSFYTTACHQLLTLT